MTRVSGDFVHEKPKFFSPAAGRNKRCPSTRLRRGATTVRRGRKVSAKLVYKYNYDQLVLYHCEGVSSVYEYRYSRSSVRSCVRECTAAKWWTWSYAPVLLRQRDTVSPIPMPVAMSASGLYSCELRVIGTCPAHQQPNYHRWFAIPSVSATGCLSRARAWQAECGQQVKVESRYAGMQPAPMRSAGVPARSQYNAVRTQPASVGVAEMCHSQNIPTRYFLVAVAVFKNEVSAMQDMRTCQSIGHAHVHSFPA